MEIKISDKKIGDNHPTYIIAELGSNFDGDINRAKALIDLAKECGADCVKFQSFKMEKIISAENFTGNISFQSNWKKSVPEVYKDAEFPREWHKKLFEYCKEKNIDFSSAPYDYEAVDILAKMTVPYIKIGSGEITNLLFLRYVAKRGKPIFLSTGASTLDEIEETVRVIREEGNENLVLLQCVTNYPSPFKDANIKAMQLLREKFNLLVGYSDHTNDPGDIVPLGAVSLGACVIEKHFTDDRSRIGPDHPSSLDPKQFKKMVQEIRILEEALGKKEKVIYPSEMETSILQRRILYTTKDLTEGKIIEESDITILRPATKGGILPKDYNKIIGKKLLKNIKKGKPLFYEDLQ